ncbi:hypothetical protein ykris0001_39080 [Yersinia kristensenii ATCC 33638]|nr:hypothetical protein ykris0001_39080 [Yersinia kristensenii ATCC 33638]
MLLNDSRTSAPLGLCVALNLAAIFLFNIPVVWLPGKTAAVFFAPINTAKLRN